MAVVGVGLTPKTAAAGWAARGQRPRTVVDSLPGRTVACPSCRSRMGGEEALRQWRALEQRMAPLQAGAALFPAAAIRGDPGILLTAGRYGPGLLQAGLVANKLTGPFSGEMAVDEVAVRQQAVSAGGSMWWLASTSLTAPPANDSW